MNLVTRTTVVLLIAACGGSSGGGDTTAREDTLTQRQRDSILAQSRIPGARGVQKAHDAADSTSARVQAADTVGP